MDDLISRQAAIDDIWTVSPLACLDRKWVDRWLRQLPPIQPEPHWIPVTERLPEEDDYRPCYGYEDGAVWWRNDMGLMGLGWYYPSTGKWAYYDESDRCEKCVGNVVEWMPLPK